MFRHPKYYKELRKLRNKEARVNDHSASISDQAISPSDSTEPRGVRPGPGPKLQAREDSTANSTRGRVAEPQASSDKPQASSSKLVKPQATSFKPRG